MDDDEVVVGKRSECALRLRDVVVIGAGRTPGMSSGRSRTRDHVEIPHADAKDCIPRGAAPGQNGHTSVTTGRHSSPRHLFTALFSSSGRARSM
jgi:hypothetical protein